MPYRPMFFDYENESYLFNATYVSLTKRRISFMLEKLKSKSKYKSRVIAVLPHTYFHIVSDLDDNLSRRIRNRHKSVD